jgi:uncharacterized membrane protein
LTDGRTVATVCGTVDDADRALAALEPLRPRDAVVVTRSPDRRVQLHQTRQHGFGEGAVAGGSVGVLAGLLVGLPLAAAAAGIAGGGLWSTRDIGIDDNRLRQLGLELEPGQAAACALVSEQTAAEATALLSAYGSRAVTLEIAPA